MELLHVRIDRRIKAWLRRQAREEGVTVSIYVRRILRAAIRLSGDHRLIETSNLVEWKHLSEWYKEESHK